MSTWAVDLKDIAAVYPWQGTEFLMAVAGIVAWILWHFIQVSKEGKTYEENIRKYAGAHDAMRKSLDDNP